MSKLTQDKGQLDLDLAARKITREQYEQALALLLIETDESLDLVGHSHC